MNREPASPVWPSAPPPAAVQGLTWSLDHVSQLPRVRAQLRRHLAEARGAGARDAGRSPDADELDAQVVLAFDEMASNALRHGGGGVAARLAPHRGSWLVEVCDDAAVTPPIPAVDRDPSLGGLGLHLIAQLATAHGWHASGRAKSVWALLPR